MHNTQPTQETDVQVPIGIETRDSNHQGASDLGVRPQGQRDQHEFDHDWSKSGFNPFSALSAYGIVTQICYS